MIANLNVRHMRVWSLRAVMTAWLLLVASVCVGDIVSDIVSMTPARAHSYSQCMDAVSRLAASPRVTVETIGYSAQGRPLPLVVARSESWADLQPWEGPPRLFLIARQHGTESSGTEATLALLNYFATTADSTSLQILDQLTIVAVPVANPDGMVASRRANAAGVDLNRDWSTQSQPETQAIARAVDRWQPLALIDLHELPANSSNPLYAQSFVETMGRDPQVCALLSEDTALSTLRLTGWLKSYGFSANVYYNSSSSSPALCHRYFTLMQGIPSYLFEAKTGPSHPLHARVKYHVLGSLVVGNHLIHTYHDGTRLPGIAVTEAPAATERESAEPAPAAEAGPELTIVQPEEGLPAEGLVPVLAQVEGDGFAYVSFSVNGVLKAVTTSAPYQYWLNADHYEEGPQRIQVAACDPAGRPMAVGERTVMVTRTTREGR